MWVDIARQRSALNAGNFGNLSEQPNEMAGIVCAIDVVVMQINTTKIPVRRIFRCSSAFSSMKRPRVAFLSPSCLLQYKTIHTRMITTTIMVAARETVKMRLVSIHFDFFVFECKGTTCQRKGCLTEGKRCLKSGISTISAVLPADTRYMTYRRHCGKGGQEWHGWGCRRVRR